MATGLTVIISENVWVVGEQFCIDAVKYDKNLLFVHKMFKRGIIP